MSPLAIRNARSGARWWCLRGVLSAALLMPFASQATEVTDYEFPEQTPVVSTVLGTPARLYSPLAAPGDIDERTYTIDLNKASISRFVEQHRRGVDVLEFSLAYQDGPAPLVVSIAGTGADHNSGKAKSIKRILSRAGFHVLSITSPTNADFIFAASDYDHAGISPLDAEALYRVIGAALDEVGDSITITDRFLTGYSLGGLNAAFLMQLDEREGKIGFSKALLINPPVNLLTSVNNLTDIATSDELLAETGVRSVNSLLDPIFTRLADYFKREGKLDLTGDAMYRIAGGVELSDFEYRALVRIAFGMSLADMVFMSDAMNGYGYVVPAGEQFSMNRGNGNLWFQRSMAWNFQNYAEIMLLPYWQQSHPDATMDTVEVAWSLLGMQDYLAGSPNIGVHHNNDDIILGPGDMDFVRETFGDRAQIYPAGGHLGNVEHRRNVNDMIAFFRD